jgi:predicted small integral membrane protein
VEVVLTNLVVVEEVVGYTALCFEQVEVVDRRFVEAVRAAYLYLAVGLGLVGVHWMSSVLFLGVAVSVDVILRLLLRRLAVH